MAKQKPQLVCDLNNKTWLNLQEAITYIGYGSSNIFKEWRETGKIGFSQPGRTIIYKRTDLDRFMEKHYCRAFDE